MMQTLGWIIIGTLFASSSAVLLWPFFRALRRHYAPSARLLLAYGFAVVGCSIGLWYAIPLLVWTFLGRNPH